MRVVDRVDVGMIAACFCGSSRFVPMLQVLEQNSGAKNSIMFPTGRGYTALKVILADQAWLLVVEHVA